MSSESQKKKESDGGAPQPQTIHGRVAKILTARELVINVGSESGVKAGQKFVVLGACPIEIRDPDTNEKLGMIDREKTRVQATEVFQKCSICRTYRVTSSPNLAISALAGISGMTRETVERLPVDTSDLAPEFREGPGFVKVNDRVISIPDPAV